MLNSNDILNYDHVIKKSLDLDYYSGMFWKILRSATLMQSFIAKA